MDVRNKDLLECKYCRSVCFEKVVMWDLSQIPYQQDRYKCMMCSATSSIEDIEEQIAEALKQRAK